MTITAASPSYVQIPGNSSATVFAAPMKCFQATDVLVGLIVAGAYSLQSSGYTVSNVDTNGGFTVTFTVAPPTGALVDLRTATPQTQPTEFANLGAYLPENTTEAMDRLTRALQDAYRRTYQFGIHGPDTDSTPWPALPNAAGRVNTGLVFDSSGLPALGVIPTTTITQAAIIGFLGADPIQRQTPGEIAASITPTNYAFPELHVHRYGTSPGTGGNDQVPWQSAISVAATGLATRGEITCEQLPYLIGGTGTLTITGPVTINGGNAALNYVAGPGNSAQIRSATNAPIFVLPTAGVGNGVAIRNINIVGTGGGNVQDGIAMTQTYPAYSRVFMQNVGIFNCGRYGINAVSCYTSEFSDVYVQGCQSGWVLGPNAGANRYYNCAAVANTSAGFDCGSTNGTDFFLGCVSEQNAYGIIFESGTFGNTMFGIHTERNTIQSVWFKSGSNKNRVHFESCGAAEPFPLNQGGAQNRWEGNFATGDNVYPLPIQRASTSYTAQVNGSTLTAMPYSTTVPTTAMGLNAMQQTITPRATGNHLIVRATGFAEITGGGTMTVAVFLNGVCLKAQGITVAAGVPAAFAVETEYTTVPLSLTLAASLSIGATSAALAANFTGVSGAYTLIFSSVEMRSVTLTNGSTAITPFAALLAAATTTITANQQVYFAQVNIGSTTASDTITLGGHSGTTRYGGVEVANISIEEFRPSTG